MGRARSFVAAGLLPLLAACGGGGGGGGGGGAGAPATVSYPVDPAVYRAGVAISANVPVVAGGAPTSWTVLPPLPAGLDLDPSTGTISGLPSGASATSLHTVTASNTVGSAMTVLSVQVAPALPAEVLSLADGFQAERWLFGLAIPDKIAFAPDGRLFFTELQTGNIRVHDGTQLLPVPFAALPVLNGPEQGLLGLALAPDFATSGHLFVFQSTNLDAIAMKPARNRIVRFTAVGNAGTAPTVIVDDLPIGNVHNAGDLEFGPDGHLYATVGDTDVMDLAQTAGSLAGRVLRYTATGAIPAGNPSASSPEWARGMRNTFDLTFHPVTGSLYGAENGPTSQDEINFIQAGKDYGWPMPASGPTSGYRMTEWTPVIAPTSLVLWTGGAFGPAFDNNLFVGGYVDQDIRRLVLSGATFADLDAELPFLSFVVTGGVHKPLSMAKGPDGALYVSTFDSIWRISKAP